MISKFHFPVMAIYIRHIRAVMPGCDESLKTLREGYSCPSNQLEWEERAKEMKCESVIQNCTENNDFVYHCLINAWPNGTLEVCAPRQIIAGSYCAEFNKGGARVQTQYRSQCRSCPYKYNSSDSFKYQECYDLVKTLELSTKEEQTERTSPVILDISKGMENPNITNSTETQHQRGSRLQEWKIAAIVAVISLIPLMSLFIFCKIWRKHRKSADRSTNTEVNVLKINKDLLKYLSKVTEEKLDSLSKKILDSPFWNKYADSKPNDYDQIEVTGDFKEDMDIQAAVDVLNIRIYVAIRLQYDEETVVCFLPKDPDAEKWMKISLDSSKQTYKFLSDGDSRNEEAAQLTYDHVFSWKTEEDGGEMIPKGESTNVLSVMDESDPL